MLVKPQPQPCNGGHGAFGAAFTGDCKTKHGSKAQFQLHTDAEPEFDLFVDLNIGQHLGFFNFIHFLSFGVKCICIAFIHICAESNAAGKIGYRIYA